MPPVHPLRWRGRHPPRGQPGDPHVARQAGGHRAHLHERQHREAGSHEPPRPRRQCGEPERGEDGEGAEQGQRVAQVLVLDQLEHDERRHGRDEQEPPAADDRHAEPDRHQHGRTQTDLVAEVPRIEQEPGQRERRGLTGRGGLGEGAGVDLGTEAEQPRPEPRQAQHDRDEQGQRCPDQAPATSPQQQPQRRRHDVQRERGLGEHAEAADHPERQRGPAAREVLRGKQGGEGQRDHRGQGQVELQPQRGVDDERRCREDQPRRPADAIAAELLTEASGREHSEPEEREQHGHRRRLDRQHQRHRAGQAQHERRIERGPLEHRADVARPQILGALDRALQVVGVIPLRRAAVDRHPHRRHRDQRREDAGRQEPAAAGRHHRRPISSSEAPPGIGQRGTRADSKANNVPSTPFSGHRGRARS